MKVLDLFSGIGGFSLGLERAGMKTVAFCEIDSFCQKVLKKHWPHVPIFNDIRRLNYEGSVDVICGGYPCQPFSVAGKRKGSEDDRHLWPEMLACIKKYRPSWIIGENVAGHINLGLDNVLTDLEGEGYRTRVFVIPACAIGAPHRRDRVWIIGYQQAMENTRCTLWTGRKNCGDNEAENKTRDAHKLERSSGTPANNVAYTTGKRQSEQGKFEQSVCTETQRKRQTDFFKSVRFENQWCIEPDVGRVAHGVSNRVDRLGALGNAVVPQIPEIIGRAIMEASL